MRSIKRARTVTNPTPLLRTPGARIALPVRAPVCEAVDEAADALALEAAGGVADEHS